MTAPRSSAFSRPSDTALAREIVQLHAEAADGVIGCLRVMVESIAGVKAALLHPGDQPTKVVCEAETATGAFSVFAGSSGHRCPSAYICTFVSSPVKCQLAFNQICPLFSKWRRATHEFQKRVGLTEAAARGPRWRLGPYRSVDALAGWAAPCEAVFSVADPLQAAALPSGAKRLATQG
jgi:hypothetical protein